MYPEQGLAVGGRTGTRAGLQNQVFPTPVLPGKRETDGCTFVKFNLIRKADFFRSERGLIGV